MLPRCGGAPGHTGVIIQLSQHPSRRAVQPQRLPGTDGQSSAHRQASGDATRGCIKTAGGRGAILPRSAKLCHSPAVADKVCSWLCWRASQGRKTTAT